MVYEFYKALTPKEFRALIDQSDEYCEYVRVSMMVGEESAQNLVPTMDGGLIVTLIIPPYLAKMIEAPPIVDLEAEPLERSEVGR